MTLSMKLLASQIESFLTCHIEINQLKDLLTKTLRSKIQKRQIMIDSKGAFKNTSKYPIYVNNRHSNTARQG